ncbi:YmfQ family protein [Tissierella pigra]|uniref:putative phage tail protein n=1 Tax=Tissierella pigra TaxID=2607614 RepID=UPI001C112193|nr:putative phage tail protein [Tissierella pigra]MBU5427149.1 YmfQ family protein [Tissierella pigra]
MSRLLEYLPIYERSSIVFQEILNSEQMEFDRLGLNIEDLEKQFFIDTATWGLAIYEKELKLPIRPKKILEERRSLIKSKMRGMGKVDLAMIKSIIEAYTRSTADIIFDGRINIKFTNEGTITLNISDMFNAIEEIKPAHLDYDITLNYKQKLSEIYIASALIAGEEITVYPYSPKELLSKGNIYIATGSNTGLEKVIIYPRKEVI